MSSYYLFYNYSCICCYLTLWSHIQRLLWHWIGSSSFKFNRKGEKKQKTNSAADITQEKAQLIIMKKNTHSGRWDGLNRFWSHWIKNMLLGRSSPAYLSITTCLCRWRSDDRLTFAHLIFDPHSQVWKQMFFIPLSSSSSSSSFLAWPHALMSFMHKVVTQNDVTMWLHVNVPDVLYNAPMS